MPDCPAFTRLRVPLRCGLAPYRNAATGSGFTLLESLLTIAIVSALVIIVIVSVNPMRQFAQVRNAHRTSNVRTLIEAIQQHALDNKGAILRGIDVTLRMLGTAGTGCDISCDEEMTTEGCVDFSAVLVPDYIDMMVFDPKFGSPERTYYAVKTTEIGRLQVVACAAELGMEVGLIR